MLRVRLPSLAMTSDPLSNTLPLESVTTFVVLKPSAVFSPLMVSVVLLPVESVLVMVVVNEPSEFFLVTSEPTTLPDESIRVTLCVELPSALSVSSTFRDRPLVVVSELPVCEDCDAPVVVSIPVDISYDKLPLPLNNAAKMSLKLPMELEEDVEDEEDDDEASVEAVEVCPLSLPSDSIFDMDC